MSKLLTAAAITAVASAGLIAAPAQASVSGPPSAPKGLTVARDGAQPHDLNIAWKPVPGGRSPNGMTLGVGITAITASFP